MKNLDSTVSQELTEKMRALGIYDFSEPCFSSDLWRILPQGTVCYRGRKGLYECVYDGKTKYAEKQVDSMAKMAIHLAEKLASEVAV